MKITFLTAGTRGDTQPYIALGVQLRKLGHSITIAASEGFKGLVHSYNLNYIRSGGNIQEIMKSGLVDDALNADNPIKALAALRNKHLIKAQLDIQEAYVTACKDADVIIYHPGGAVGYYIAKSMKIPAFLAAPFPFLPTKEYPALLLYGKRIPRALYRFSHHAFLRGFWMTIKRPIITFLKKYMPDVKPYHNPMITDEMKLVSCSDQVFKTEPPGVAKGFWFLDEPDDFAPDPALVEFIEAGAPPVYIGFGSMVEKEDALYAKTELLIEAVLKSGLRAVLAIGYGGISACIENKGQLFLINEVPHAWLFPRMSLLIHHGGAGTAAAALRSGIPSLVIPHANDQFAWGERLFELGVAAKPITLAELNNEILMKRIQSALSAEVATTAKELGLRIAGEDGARMMAEFLNQQFDRNSG